MEKVEKYRTYIKQLLTEYSHSKPSYGDERNTTYF